MSSASSASACKTIAICGKRNQDKMAQMCDPGVVIERKASKKWVWDDQYYTHEKQVGVVNVLYTNSSNTLLDNDGIPDAKIPTMQFFRSEIDKKCKGYRAQDTEHAIYDDRYFVSVDDVIERMVGMIPADASVLENS